jgi:RNA recognition motif-containing protein
VQHNWPNSAAGLLLLLRALLLHSLIEYSADAEATAAIEQLNNTELGGRAVHVRLDRSNIDTTGGFPVFVGNLPWSTSTEELGSMFAQFQPYDVHVKTNMAGRSR